MLNTALTFPCRVLYDVVGFNNKYYSIESILKAGNNLQSFMNIIISTDNWNFNLIDIEKSCKNYLLNNKT